jgi:type IV secretory pathway TrbD component
MELHPRTIAILLMSAIPVVAGVLALWFLLMSYLWIVTIIAVLLWIRAFVILNTLPKTSPRYVRGQIQLCLWSILTLICGYHTIIIYAYSGYWPF